MTVLPPSELRKVTESPIFPKPFTRLTNLINRFQLSPETVVLLLSILIGGSTGMGVVTFHYLIQLTHQLMLENFMGVVSIWGAWTVSLVPMIGGIIVGLMRWYAQDFGPGISSLIDAEATEIKKPLKPVTKMLAAAVSLGSGAALGPEGPSVEIGGNFGILLSVILKVSRERQRLLLSAGAAAGLAAGFNAPIAGVFFALEVVMGASSFATSAVSVVLLAAVVAALIAQIGLGAQPAFALPVYEVRSLLELPLYLGLGLAASLVALTYTSTVTTAKAAFAGEIPSFKFLSRIPQSIHPLIGGLILGIITWQLPPIFGIGYETIEAMLQDVEFSLPLLMMLLVVKLLVTAISAATGFVGGLFAPAMFLGAALGATYAKIFGLVFPSFGEIMAAPPAYAMVGMAAVLAASVRAPLTSILILFELTRDYRIVLPLMAAVGLSVWLIERIQPNSNFNSNLQKIGLSPLKDEQREILQQLLVKDAMVVTLKKLPANLGVMEAAREMSRDRCRSALVVSEAEQLVGILSIEDINRFLSAEQNYIHSSTGVAQIIDICTTEILYAWHDELLSEALDRMALRGLHQLPVVAKDNHESILGLLERDQISLTCSLAITDRKLEQLIDYPLGKSQWPEEKSITDN